jgi:hypothetical protein
MDAMAFYIIVRLANGDPHMAMKTPLRGEACETVRDSDRAQRVLDEQIRAKPKLITWFCADVNAYHPKVSSRAPASAGPPALPVPSVASRPQHPASSQ